MQRVMIIGLPGSGKSTLATSMGARLGLPVYHIDRDVFWLPGWQERPADGRQAAIQSIIAREAWVFEGFNSSTFQMRGARADTLIWLDLPLTLRVVRVIRRAIRSRGQTRPDLAPDCPERLDMLPEFLWYILRTWRRHRRKAQQFFDSFPRTKHRMGRTGEVAAFLASLPRTQGEHPA